MLALSASRCKREMIAPRRVSGRLTPTLTASRQNETFRTCSKPQQGGDVGYSRWENRSSHLCYKTVRESFPSPGSSVLRLLSRVPRRACGGLFFHAFAPCEAHPYLTLAPVQSVYGATSADHLRITVPTSAYPLAFLAALASWGIPPPCHMRLTPAHWPSVRP